MIRSFSKFIPPLIYGIGLFIFPAPAPAEVSADFSRDGAVRLGTSTTPCDAAATGALRWSSVSHTIEMCDGSTEWRKIVGNITVPAISAPNPDKGFFVLSALNYQSDLGDLAGADATCLSDLSDHDWNGKAEAVSRGLLNSTKVRAWLCVNSGCQDLIPEEEYQFAVSDAPGKGGATIRVGSDGLTHNNTQNWSGHNYWGVGNYFTGRDEGTATVFGGPIYNSCRGWTYAGDSGSDYGAQGDSNHTNKNRWHTTTYGTCNQPLKLICIVDP